MSLLSTPLPTQHLELFSPSLQYLRVITTNTRDFGADSSLFIIF